MRPQQNRRISNNNRRTGGAMRRSPNPLTRNYESTGPDVKIRGNAQHVADKYLALARDAHALGDRVMGENYLQHAEHYIRIILSNQANEHERRSGRGEQAESQKAEIPLQNQNFSIRDDGSVDDALPQPIIDGMPGEVALIGRNGGYKEDTEEDNNSKSDRTRPRRRLPARHSNGAIRQPARAEGEERFDIVQTVEKTINLNEDSSEQGENISAHSNPIALSGNDKKEKVEVPGKQPRPRRPRRAKASAETEQAGNL